MKTGAESWGRAGVADRAHSPGRSPPLDELGGDLDRKLTQKLGRDMPQDCCPKWRRIPPSRGLLWLAKQTTRVSL